MSDSQSNGYSDEDKYANDSFETEVPESSVYGSDNETSEGEKPKSASKELKSFARNNDFWTCESSSDEDDVVLGHTIAEINTDPGDFNDDNISLTPAARVFQMASVSRISSGINIDNHDDLTECEDLDDELEDIDDGTIGNDSDAEDIFKEYTKIHEESEIIYDERIVFETSGIEVDEVYTDAGLNDVSELDVGEPNFFHDSNNDDKDVEQCNFEEEIDYDNVGYSDIDAYPNDSDYDDDEKTIEATSIFTYSTQEDVRIETICETRSLTKSQTKIQARNEPKRELSGESKSKPKIEPEIELEWEPECDEESEPEREPKSDPKSETKSLRTDDSMEDFKRKVMLSERFRCTSDGAGDRVRSKVRKSGIPVWVGNERSEKSRESPKEPRSAPGVRSLIPVPESRTHSSLPDFSDADTLTPNESEYHESEEGAFGFDELNAENDGNDYMADDLYSECTAADSEGSQGIESCTYSMQMEMFVDTTDVRKKPKKLKAGERRNKSFSNDRLRDIERHNHILLHKILNQKPTYILDEKKKKKDKFASLPPTTRKTSAEINRKKQQRQIDNDNQMLKRKLEAISKRKPKTKPK